MTKSRLQFDMPGRGITLGPPNNLETTREFLIDDDITNSS